tara:strand:+ start:74 stop:883 length:810 start_codon:yes stop_codon:yes gene_type:complete
MAMKTCSECGEEKALTAEYFHRRRSAVSGYQSPCRICKNKRAKKYREANREKVLAGQKKWREENRDKLLAYGKEYREQNREKCVASVKKWQESNRERRLAGQKKYCEANREKVLAGQKKWRNENPEKVVAGQRKWREENPEKVSASCKKYRKARRRNDPTFRLQCNLRTGLWQCLSGKQKKSRTLEYIGIDLEKLWEHFKSKFTDGMTRENYGGWHVDHIRPLCSFDFDLYEEGSEEYENLLHQAWHYTNLQPLWAKDNLSKHSKWEVK